MMVIAPEASIPAQLEYYTILMFSKITETNVPTWIVGE